MVTKIHPDASGQKKPSKQSKKTSAIQKPVQGPKTQKKHYDPDEREMDYDQPRYDNRQTKSDYLKKKKKPH